MQRIIEETDRKEILAVLVGPCGTQWHHSTRSESLVGVLWRSCPLGIVPLRASLLKMATGPIIRDRPLSAEPDTFVIHATECFLG
jgi:hypothetical protein